MKKSLFGYLLGLLLGLVLLAIIPAIAYAQTDPEIPGLVWGELIAVAGSIMVITNLIKRFTHINGKVILIISGAMSMVWAISQYQPDVHLIAYAFAYCFGIASGAWETLKLLAHKAGVPKQTTPVNLKKPSA